MCRPQFMSARGSVLQREYLHRIVPRVKLVGHDSVNQVLGEGGLRLALENCGVCFELVGCQEKISQASMTGAGWWQRRREGSVAGCQQKLLAAWEGRGPGERQRPAVLP
jgi:hypothetical protein